MAPAARIAMWSGPRTVSTALMRAWENRPDTAVVDEPLYAFYLARTGIDHPGRDEIIASMRSDWRGVLDQLTRGAGREGGLLRQAHDPPSAAGGGPAGAGAAAPRPPHPRPGRAARLLREGAVRADHGGSGHRRAGGDLRRVRRAGAGFAGPAGAAGTDAARVVRGAGRALPPGDAVLAAGAARQRRGVGAALVRQRLGLDRVRPLPAPGRAAARASG